MRPSLRQFIMMQPCRPLFSTKDSIEKRAVHFGLIFTWFRASLSCSGDQQPGRRVRACSFRLRLYLIIFLLVFIADVRKHAIGVAVELAARGVSAGDHVMLVLPPGLEALVAFWACVYAGVVAVPVMPPDPSQTAVRPTLFCSPSFLPLRGYLVLSLSNAERPPSV